MMNVSIRPWSGTRLVRNSLAGHGLLAFVGIVVLGILGMHALGLHGTGTPMSDDAPTASMSHTQDIAASTYGALDHVDRALAGTTTMGIGEPSSVMKASETSSDGRHGMVDMVVLCVAVLAGAVALLLSIALLCRRPRRWDPTGALRTTLTSFVPSRVGTGPPPAWQFSVIRC